MNYKTLKELRDLKKSKDYNHFALYNSKGEIIINFQALKTKREERLEEILRRLENENLPNGIYIIKAKLTQSKSLTPDEFFYKKGDTEEPIQENLQECNENKKPMDQTHIIELAELRIECKYLKQQNEDLKKQLQEIQEDLEQLESEAEELSEAPAQTNQITDLLKGLGETALPVLESYFDLQSKKTEAQLEYLKSQNKKEPIITPPPPPPPPFDPAEEYIEEPGNQAQPPGDPGGYSEAAYLHSKFNDLAAKDPEKATFIMDLLINPEKYNNNEQEQAPD